MSNVGKILSLLVVKWTAGKTWKSRILSTLSGRRFKDYKLVFHTLAFLIKLT